MRNLVLNLTSAIAELADDSFEKLHITIVPTAKDRISFGGKLVA